MAEKRGAGAPAWGQQPGESAQAYAAFSAYYLMPAATRSIDAAWRSTQPDAQQKGNRRAPGHWTRWSRQNDWVDRARLWDAHQAEVVRRTAEAQWRKEVQRYSEQQRRLAEATLTGAISLMQKAAKRLESLQPDEITPSTLPAFFRAAADLSESAGDAWATTLGLAELFRALDETADG